MTSAVVSFLSHHYGAVEKSFCNVLDFFEKEMNLGRRVCVRSAVRRTALACKVSVSTEVSSEQSLSIRQCC